MVREKADDGYHPADGLLVYAGFDLTWQRIADIKVLLTGVDTD